VSTPAQPPFYDVRCLGPNKSPARLRAHVVSLRSWQEEVESLFGSSRGSFGALFRRAVAFGTHHGWLAVRDVIFRVWIPHRRPSQHAREATNGQD
jgi:hypothetical protein